MNELVIFSRTDLSVAATNEALALRDSALEKSALVSIVTDEAGNIDACEAMKALKGVLSLAEKARKSVKEPFLNACRQIDETASKFIAEVKSEYDRLALASADWQMEQTRKMQEIERKRREEFDRLERERLEAIRRVEEERTAKEREAAVKAAQEAASARSEADRKAAEERAEAERKRIADEAEKQKLSAQALADQEKLTLPLEPQRPKAAGQTVREEWDFEVVNPFDLVRSNPGCVEITVRRSEVKALIDVQLRSGINPPKVPGLRVFLKTKVSVRPNGLGSVVDV